MEYQLKHKPLLKPPHALPNEQGFFGEYGGQFIPPHLKEAMDEIHVAYEEIRHTPEFQ
ncbi:hypothetical protein IAF28_19995, partial [Acinetobacter baumannii]|nr:hypothetical protein [Acinetobacter baumannii]